MAQYGVWDDHVQRWQAGPFGLSALARWWLEHRPGNGVVAVRAVHGKPRSLTPGDARRLEQMTARAELMDIRKRLGYSQRVMAEALGLTKAWYGTLERGQAEVSRTILLAARGLLCRATHGETPAHR